MDVPEAVAIFDTSSPVHALDVRIEARPLQGDIAILSCDITHS